MIMKDNDGKQRTKHDSETDDAKKETLSNSSKTKDELVVLEQKMHKCNAEITHLNLKLQKEWSKSMNNHLRNFYGEDSTVTPLKSGGNSAAANECEKKIHLLKKKLESYDKRRQKVLQEKAAVQAAATTTTASTGTNTSTTSTTAIPTTSSTSSTATTTTVTAATESTLTSSQEPPLITMAGLQPPPGLNPNTLPLAAKKYQRPTITNNSSSAAIVDMMKSAHDSNVSESLDAPATSDELKGFFYKDPETAVSTARFNPYNLDRKDDAEFGPATEQDQLNQINNKLLQNMLVHYEQEFTLLKLHQEKIIQDMDDMQKKVTEHFQHLSKDIQKSNQSMQEPMHNLSFHLFKRLDELKTPLDRIQALGYALTHCHDDVKETKEDVVSIKTRIDIIERSQKVHTIDASPTSYYQLFYKFLDIILTLTTIVLLAVTHVISSIKFVIMLYPRGIVLFLLLYLMFYMFVDYELFDEYFYNFVTGVDESDFSRSDKSAILRNDSLYTHHTNLTMLSKVAYTVYRFFTQGRNASALVNSATYGYDAKK